MSDPVPSYVGVAGAVNGYVKPGYQRYYSTQSGVPVGTPPPIVVTPPTPPTPPEWPHLPPTLPPLTCPPLDSTWAAGPVEPTNQMSYTPPVSAPNDDGINFPVSSGDVVLRQGWHGVASTVNPLNLQLINLQIEQIIHDTVKQRQVNRPTPSPSLSAIGQPIYTFPVIDWYDVEIAVQEAVIKSMLQGNNLWFELVLKPLTNGPFGSYYVVASDPLPVPMTINLQAPST